MDRYVQGLGNQSHSFVNKIYERQLETQDYLAIDMLCEHQIQYLKGEFQNEKSEVCGKEGN